MYRYVRKREGRRRHPLWRRLVRLAVGIPAGLVAVLVVLSFIYERSPHPLVRIVTVAGDSMEPTLSPGECVIFGRREWTLDSIVLANVPEEGEVVKRVVERSEGMVLITGDNREVTATYLLPEERIAATCLLATGVNVGEVQVALHLGPGREPAGVSAAEIAGEALLPPGEGGGKDSEKG